MERMRAVRPVEALISLAGLGFLAAAGYWSVRLAYADYRARESSLESFERAVELAPASSTYRRWLADSLAASGQDPQPILESALARDPDRAELWIDAGIHAEMNNDFARAESLLVQAARVSRQFQPRWSLANYYFRRGQDQKFWSWSAAALGMAYADPSPLFELCWRVSRGDSAEVLRRAIPDRPAVLRAYLQFLIARGRLEDGGAVVPRLLARAGEPDTALLKQYCSRLVDAGSALPALDLWNRLCARRLLPYAPLTGSGSLVTNGDFSAPPQGEGFDWRLQPQPGISMAVHPEARLARFSFSGKQPQECELLNQFLPVAPGRHYRLRYRYRTSVTEANMGLRWQILRAASRDELAAAGFPASPDWTAQSLSFVTAPGDQIARLVLSYQRVPGSTRMEGDVSLTGIAVEAEP